MTTKEKIGDIFVAEVRGLASDGRAILSHPSGRTFFAPGLWLHEKAKLKITGLKSRVGFASAIELLEKSDYRVNPGCQHHGQTLGQCGGCPWQFIDYDEQLREKQRRVEQAFSRIGVSENIKSIWASDQIYGYRNRAQFKSDGKRIGYVSTQSNTLAPITDCVILSDKNRQTLGELCMTLPNDQWRPKRKTQWSTLDIDEDINANDVSINRRRPFIQANTSQNTRMKAWLAEKLSKLSKETEILELFCGSGNFTEVIASQQFSHVYASEGVAASLEKIAEKQWEHIELIKADIFQEDEINRVIKKAKNAEALVLDPPRDGLKVKGNLLGKTSKLRDIFYISCDTATLIRDVIAFQQHKFKIKDVQPLDQFPHTPHIECLVHLTKRKK